MSRKQLIWLFACITLVLAIVVLYQQRTIQTSRDSIRSVRNNPSTSTQVINETSGDTQNTDIEVITGTLATGSSTTGTTTQVVITQPQDSTCVLSYQALVDRINDLGTLGSGEVAAALNNATSLSYCNGNTPQESDFLRIQSQGQVISYDPDAKMLNLDNVSVAPAFVLECGDDCPTVQSITNVRGDNKYAVLDVSQARSYQHSFRLVSLTNGVTMMFWSSLDYVDSLASYAWSDDGHFVFIASSGRETKTYIVQPKAFPTNVSIAEESDTPIALTINGSIVTVLYDRNPSNTDTSDRYSTSYEINTLGLNPTIASGSTVE